MSVKINQHDAFKSGPALAALGTAYSVIDEAGHCGREVLLPTAPQAVAVALMPSRAISDQVELKIQADRMKLLAKTKLEHFRLIGKRSNCMAHPSVMMRRVEVLAAGGCRAGFAPCEDYDLWLLLAEAREIGNLAAPLLFSVFIQGR